MVTARYPVAPNPSPLVGTLLDTATMDDDGIEWLHDGKALFESYNCMKFQHEATLCAPNTKSFDQAGGWVDGFPLFVYGGVVCKSVGLDQAEMLSKVQTVFEAGESTAVEQGLMARGFMSQSGATPGTQVVNITPAGGAVKPSLGIAMLEGYSASKYVGAPTIHIPVSIASLLLGVAAGAVLEDRVIRSKLGSKVVAGAGYDYPNLGPNGTPAAAGEKWLYATGEVVIRRGVIDPRQVMATSTNEVFVLAERGYYVAVDCFTAAIRVQETA